MSEATYEPVAVASNVLAHCLKYYAEMGNFIGCFNGIDGVEIVGQTDAEVHYAPVPQCPLMATIAANRCEIYFIENRVDEIGNFILDVLRATDPQARWSAQIPNRAKELTLNINGKAVGFSMQAGNVPIGREPGKPSPGTWFIVTPTTDNFIESWNRPSIKP